MTSRTENDEISFQEMKNLAEVNFLYISLHVMMRNAAQKSANNASWGRHCNSRLRYITLYMISIIHAYLSTNIFSATKRKKKKKGVSTYI